MDDYLYACTDVDWSGTCQSLGFFAGECYNFPAEFQKVFQCPSQGWECVVYKCVCHQNRPWLLAYLSATVTTIVTAAMCLSCNTYFNERDFNDVFSSFVCNRS